eukprot:Clim_evm7s175 gene=Clim_evmTU7s175
MTSIGTGYDLSATTFSPDGRVFQVEYANKAVDNSGTAIALRVKDGVVFGVEKIVQSRLYEPGSNRRVFTVDDHTGIVTAGLIADARQLVKRARSEASEYRSVYGAQIPGHMLCQRLSGYVQAHTLYSHIRPFGVAILIGLCTSKGPQLYCIEPSGVSWGYYGAAIGKGKQTAKTEIEKLKLEEMTAVEAVKEVAKLIYSVHDEVKDKDFELEMSWVTEATGGKHVAVPEEMVKEAEEAAKAALEEDDMDDD